MRGERTALRTGETLISLACRRLPARIRQERYQEWLAELPVILRDLNTGREVTIVTFADGAFYRQAVAPGDYEVTLPSDVLDRLKAYAPPLSIFVPPGPEEKRFDDLELRLEPRQ